MKSRTAATELIYGFHPVKEALAAGRRRLHRLLVAEPAEGRRKQELMAAAGRRAVPVDILAADKFQQRVKAGGHNGVAAVADPYPLASLRQALAAGRTDLPFWVILDQLKDPRNLGAIARSACCAGVDAMVVPRDRSAPPSPAAVKASAGALEHMTLVAVTNLARTVEQLKKEGFWVAGLDTRAGLTVFEADFKVPLALVIGAEDRGIRPLVEKHCDFTVAIPQQVTIGSLNAASAATVAFFEVVRQRHYG